MNKHQKLQDPLYSLILEIQNLEDQFIHELKLAPEPSVILAYDYQLAEVAFCTESSYHSVFGIDPTFNLGQFNLIPHIRGTRRTHDLLTKDEDVATILWKQ